MEKRTREEYVLLAKIAEQTERYKDEVECMKNVATRFKETLNKEERNLLSLGYKYEIDARRKAIVTLESKISSGKVSAKAAEVKLMKARIIEEINTLCEDVLKLLNDKLIPKTVDEEDKVFFVKMKGDYTRYMAEVCEPGRKRNQLIGDSNLEYTQATKMAVKSLSPCNLIRIGLCINHIDFLYKVKENAPLAYSTGRRGLEDACVAFDKEPTSQSDSSDISELLKLLQDNLQLYKDDIVSD